MSYWEKSRHADRKPFLEARVAILRAVRRWFEAEGFTEVEPTALVLSPGAEIHVDAFEADSRYLHTSPEFAMKKLLAAGERRIFYLGKCWRKGEVGPLHAPEFTMIEWYRADAPYEKIMDDCVAIVRVATKAVGAEALRWKERACDPFAEAERVTVREAMAQHLPFSLAEKGSGDEGRKRTRDTRGLAPHHSAAPRQLDAPHPLAPSPQGRGGNAHDEFSKAIVQIEPHLGSPALTLLTEYPISEAALARRCEHDPSVAERFEIYACGVELANGYGELTDPFEQRARLIEAMDEKEKRYGRRWPVDEDFLAALAHMPPASGVAMGFDRLVMLASGARHINDVLWRPS